MDILLPSTVTQEVIEKRKWLPKKHTSLTSQTSKQQKKGHTRRGHNVSNLLIMEVSQAVWSLYTLGCGEKRSPNVPLSF